MIVRRGGKSGDVFGCACRDHGEGRGCSNRSSVPYREAHEAVIGALRRTFSPESFEAHIARLAQDTEARDRRSAERDHLLAEIPKLAAAETKLAKRVAVTDDVEALVAQLKALQAERKAAEARVGELEGIERDLRADQAQVAALQATWGEWSKLLAAHEANLSVISGGMGRGSIAVDENELWNSPAALRCMGIDEKYGGPHPIVPPISGGSDAPWVCATVRARCVAAL